MRRIGLLIVTLACVSAALGFQAPVASADTASVVISDQDDNVDPAAGIPRTVTLSGETAAAATVYAKYRPLGGPACASTPRGDFGEELSSLYGADVPTGEAFSFNIQWVFPAPGPQMFCIWIAPGSNASIDTVTTPIVQVVNLRPVTGTVSASEAPATEPATGATTVTVAGSSDIQVMVLATYRPAGGPPCAPTYDGDPGTTFVESVTIGGGPFTFISTVPFTAGPWVICTWLDTVAGDGMGKLVRKATFIGPSTSAFTALGPAPAVAPSVTSSVTPAVTRLATRVRSAFPKTAHRLRLSVLSHVSASRAVIGTCWLQVMQAGRWHAPGAHAPVTAGGTCRVLARFGGPGRRRMRIDFRPSAGFAESVGAPSAVHVTR